MDERIKKVTRALGYAFKTYGEEERFYQQIASEVGISGWELDRLLYNYTDRFVSAISASGVKDLTVGGSGFVWGEGDAKMQEPSEHEE